MKIMHKVSKILIATALVFYATSTLAIDSQRLFERKHWYVDVVAFDNGDIACEAAVTGRDVSFSIWAHSDGSVELQFFLEKEWFGEENSYRDISVRVDRRSPWDLSDAKFYKNSIFFTLPSENWDAAQRFINEIARGNTLYLFNRFGEQKAWYSLAGSSAAIDNLDECRDLLGSPNGGQSDW